MKWVLFLGLLGFLFAGSAHAENRQRVFATYPQTASALTLRRTSADFAEGRALLFGVDGVPRSFATASVYLRSAAAQHYAPAQTLIGLMYAKGDGVVQDDRMALQWYRLAAQQGYARAQINLGDMYAEGHGVSSDLVRAYAWYANARANSMLGSLSYRDASGRIANLNSRMTPAQISAAQRLIAERQAERQTSKR